MEKLLSPTFIPYEVTLVPVMLPTVVPAEHDEAVSWYELDNTGSVPELGEMVAVWLKHRPEKHIPALTLAAPFPTQLAVTVTVAVADLEKPRDEEAVTEKLYVPLDMVFARVIAPEEDTENWLLLLEKPSVFEAETVPTLAPDVHTEVVNA